MPKHTHNRWSASSSHAKTARYILNAFQTRVRTVKLAAGVDKRRSAVTRNFRVILHRHALSVSCFSYRTKVMRCAHDEHTPADDRRLSSLPMLIRDLSSFAAQPAISSFDGAESQCCSKRHHFSRALLQVRRPRLSQPPAARTAPKCRNIMHYRAIPPLLFDELSLGFCPKPIVSTKTPCSHRKGTCVCVECSFARARSCVNAGARVCLIMCG